MRLTLRAAFATSAAAVILATPLAAQTAPAPNRPFTATGTLHGCDPARGDHGVRLTAGTRYTLRAASEDFDTVLRLYQRDGGEPVAENDDADGTLNSRINYTPSETGTFCLNVSGYGGRAGGGYTVSAEVAPPVTPPSNTPTRTESTSWNVFEGELGGDGPRDYALTLAEGQLALISLESDAFDPVVEVRSADDPDGDVVAMNDDGGSGLNSFLVFAPYEAGDYLVRVRAYSSGGEGAYTLKVGQ